MRAKGRWRGMVRGAALDLYMRFTRCASHAFTRCAQPLTASPVCCRVDASTCCTAQNHHSGRSPPHQQCPRQQPGTGSNRGGRCCKAMAAAAGLTPSRSRHQCLQLQSLQRRVPCGERRLGRPVSSTSKRKMLGGLVAVSEARVSVCVPHHLFCVSASCHLCRCVTRLLRRSSQHCAGLTRKAKKSGRSSLRQRGVRTTSDWTACAAAAYGAAPMTPL